MDNREKTTNFVPSEQILSGNDYLVISNIIIYNSIKLYQKEFKSNKVPATFVKFYIYELSGYDYLFDEKLRQFFNKMNDRKTRIAVLMETFANSFPSFVLKIGEDNFVKFLEVSTETLPHSILYSPNNDKFLKSTLTSLDLAIKHYGESDELRNIEYIFKDYLYSTYTADALFEEDANNDFESNQATSQQNLSQNSKTDNFTDTRERQKRAALLTGRQIEIPKQKGRVVSVLFPVIPLPSAYPILLEKNRINTEHKVKHFMSPSEQITLINRFYFNQINYSLDFINKRKVIEHDLKKASRFDFDF